MSESETHIQQMQVRLQKMAAREETLINALNEALSCADRKLLDDVRSVTADHEARRAIIMTELQTLAERIGAFPVSARTVDTIEYEAPEPADEMPANPAPEPAALMPGGDWRKAAKNITDGLDFHLKGPRPQYMINQSS
jgi:hypothetical protein